VGQKECSRCGAWLAEDEGICPTCGEVYGRETLFQMPQLTRDMLEEEMATREAEDPDAPAAQRGASKRKTSSPPSPSDRAPGRGSPVHRPDTVKDERPPEIDREAAKGPQGPPTDTGLSRTSTAASSSTGAAASDSPGAAARAPDAPTAPRPKGAKVAGATEGGPPASTSASAAAQGARTASTEAPPSPAASERPGTGAARQAHGRKGEVAARPGATQPANPPNMTLLVVGILLAALVVGLVLGFLIVL